MKEYWIFKNEPNSIMYSYTAANKREALNQYNAQHNTRYKLARGGELWVVEKAAWRNYQFSKISTATMHM